MRLLYLLVVCMLLAPACDQPVDPSPQPPSNSNSNAEPTDVVNETYTSDTSRAEPPPAVVTRSGVTEVSADAYTETRFDILIAGSGFATQKELAGFRYVASELESTFLSMITCQLGAEYAAIFRFIRLDVTTDYIADTPMRTFTDSNAPSAFESETLAPSYQNQLFIQWNPNDPGPLPLADDSLARAIAADYQLSSGDDEPINSFFIIANVKQATGWGEYFGDGLKLAAAGVTLDDDGTINDQSMFIMIHEILHTLGLVDEYVHKNIMESYSDWDFDDDRNVARPQPDGILATLSVGDPWNPDPNPAWNAPEYCADYKMCSQQTPSGVTTQDMECPVQLQPSFHQDPCDSQCPGLLEGGFYNKSGYYRSEQACWMYFDTVTDGNRLCFACKRRIKNAICPHPDIANCEATEPTCGGGPVFFTESKSCSTTAPS